MGIQVVGAQEIKQRGIGMVDAIVSSGRAVHVVSHSIPKYVIVSEARYAEIMEGYNEAFVARALGAQSAIARGEGHRYATVAEHMAAIMAAPDDE